jgi:hypothetical protein
VEGEGAPATQAMGTAWRCGKTERRSRATHSAPHLGRGQTVEGDRRRRAVCNRDGTGGGGSRLGRKRGRSVRLGGEAGAARVRFIGAGRSVRGNILSFAGLQWPAMEVREKSRRGLRPAGFSVDWCCVN